MEIMEVIIRALLSLTILFIITKLIGKKQISQLSLFDYVIGISIGNFAAEMTINLELNYLYGIFSVVVFGLCAYLVNVLTMKSIILRRFFMGTPTILIQNGQILIENLRKAKFDINDLLEECRNNNCFDISEIEYAIMEANGKVSLLLKSEYKPLTPNDMNLKTSASSLLANIIIDGKVMKNNLKAMNKNSKWLEKLLKVKGVNIEDILLCTLDDSEKVIIYKKNDNVTAHNVLE